MGGFNRAFSSAGSIGATDKFQQAKSGSPYKDAGGTVLNGGNAITSGGGPKGPNVTNTLTLATDSFFVGRISGRLMIGGSPSSSGNQGIMAPMTNYPFFANNTKGKYVGMIICNTIAGSGNTILQSTGADGLGRKHGFNLTPNPRFQYLSISSWSYVTGKATYSGLQGLTYTLGPDKAASDTTYAVPGHLTYMYGAIKPSGDVYKRRNNF